MTKISTTSNTNADKIIVQIGWIRYLIARKDAQGLVDIFANAKVVDRDYGVGSSYSYISGPAEFSVHTLTEEIEPAKRIGAVNQEEDA